MTRNDFIHTCMSSGRFTSLNEAIKVADKTETEAPFDEEDDGIDEDTEAAIQELIDAANKLRLGVLSSNMLGPDMQQRVLDLEEAIAAFEGDEEEPG